MDQVLLAKHVLQVTLLGIASLISSIQFRPEVISEWLEARGSKGKTVNRF